MATKESAAPYKESDDHVPSPYDMTGTINTSGIGSPQSIESASVIVEADRRAVAEAVLSGEAEIVFAGENSAPPPKDQIEALEKVAQEKAAEGPIEIGDPTPAEAEAAKETGSEDKTEDKTEGEATTAKTAAAKTSTAKN